MAKKQSAAKTRNSRQWTEARYRQFIKTALRQASKRWGPRNQCLKEAFLKKGTNPKTGKACKLYQCSHCNELFPQNLMRVDHVEPVIDPIEGFKDWDTVIERMFVEVWGFEALCVDCHKKKTDEERWKRQHLSVN